MAKRDIFPALWHLALWPHLLYCKLTLSKYAFEFQNGQNSSINTLASRISCKLPHPGKLGNERLRIPGFYTREVLDFVNVVFMSAYNL